MFGIPTVQRSNAYYIIETINSLLSNIKPVQQKDIIIAIFIAETNISYRHKVTKDIQKQFPLALSNGIIMIIEPNYSFYPSFKRIPLLFGDKPARVQWRSKQALDYSFLYYQCKDLAEYFVQLEDDIVAVSNYLDIMKDFVKQHQKERWSVLEFGSRGFIGMMYKSKHLPALARFVRFFFWTMPVDWLFRAFNDIFLYRNSKRFKMDPPVFKHVGKISSLNGQFRRLEDLEVKKTPQVSIKLRKRQS